METRDTPGQPAHEFPDLLAGRDKYNVILDINNAIIANLGIKELFNSIANALREAFPVDCTAIAQYEEAQDSLSVLAIEPFASSVDVETGFEMPRQGTHSGWVIEHRQPLIAKDLEKEQRFEIDGMLLEQGLRSYIVLPLVARGGVIGTFNIGSPSPNRYSRGGCRLRRSGRQATGARHRKRTSARGGSPAQGTAGPRELLSQGRDQAQSQLRGVDRA